MFGGRTPRSVASAEKQDSLHLPGALLLEPAADTLLAIRIPAASIKQGNHTHIASDINTSSPREERKRDKPMGDTWIG